MLLTSLAESQAVLGLRFFSPSAATLCRGTPDPTLGLPGRPPGRPGPQPGPIPGPGRLGDVIRSVGDWRCGPGRAGARSGPGAGLRAGSHFGGFDFRPGGRLRGLPTSRGRAPPTLFPPTRGILLSCLPCVAVSARSSTQRGGSWTDPDPGLGGSPASTPSRGSLGALWRRAASAVPGSGPFLCPEQCAGPG